MSAHFVTATGTEIGKTFVTAGLIRHLRAAGRAVEALKPVATGFDMAQISSSDAGVLLAALNRALTPYELQRMSPWRFAAPMAPNMAARREERAISFDTLVTDCRDAIRLAGDVLLIEGVGGVMVPLDDSHTVIDWIAALRISALVVVGSYLGSMSHALTTLDALRQRGIPVTALVVNETPASSVPIADTVATLRRFAAPIPVLALPRLPSATAQHLTFVDIAALL